MGPQTAFNAFLVYFALLHTPNHYHTELTHGNTRLVVLGLLCSAALLLLPCTWPLRRGFTLTDGLQRVVIAHIATTERAGSCARRGSKRLS